MTLLTPRGFGRSFCAASIALSLVSTRPLAGRLPADQSGAAAYTYRVVNTYPHDARAFTQGLIYRDGVLFESTGLNGRSTLRKVRIETGEVLQEYVVPAQYFAEGLTDWGEQLVQLTWKTNIAFVYDRGTFALRSTFRYTGEGWGLTHDRSHLIMSDGSATLRVLDPRTFAPVRRIAVRDGAAPVPALNELEFVKDEILANVWQTDRICRIDPRTGRVVGWIDLSGLLPASERGGADVLNGIAYDRVGDRLFVTGKLWPHVFEIRLERRLQ